MDELTKAKLHDLQQLKREGSSTPTA